MRVELRDGQWAELRERITHAEDKVFKKMYRSDEPGAVFDVPTVMLRTFIREWSINDNDGKPINLSDKDAIDRLPNDIADLLWDEASDLYNEATVPKRAYAMLIALAALGNDISGSQIDALPEPELFRDALILGASGTWTPKDLDETDALLLALIRQIRNVRVKRGA